MNSTKGKSKWPTFHIVYIPFIIVIVWRSRQSVNLRLSNADNPYFDLSDNNTLFLIESLSERLTFSHFYFFQNFSYRFPILEL